MDFVASYVKPNMEHTFICKNCKTIMCGKYLFQPVCPKCGGPLSMSDKVGWYTQEQEVKIAKRIVENME